MTGEPDGPPTRYGLSIVDLMTGLAAAFGLLAGVVKARETGVGMDVDTSLFDVAMHNLNYPGTWYLNGGTVTGRTARSGHPSLVPSQLYRTQDGWLFIMCNKEKFWPLLARRSSAIRSGSTTPSSPSSRSASRTATASPACSTTR